MPPPIGSGGALRRGSLVLVVLGLLGASLLLAGSNARLSTAAEPTPRLIFPGQFEAAGVETHVFQVMNAGTAPATVRAQWFSNSGDPVGPVRSFGAVAPGASFEYAAAGDFPNEFPGTLIFSADQPLEGNDTAYRTIRGAVSVAGRTGHQTRPGSTGSVVSLPYVSNALEGTYNTDIHIANAGDAIACVSIRYSFVPGAGSVPAGGKADVVQSGPGGVGCAEGFPVAPSGSISFSPDATPFAQRMPNATVNTLMAATVTSTGSAVVAVVDARLSDGLRKAAAYEGFLVSSTPPAPSDVGTDIAIPVALKTADGYYSQILMSNPGPVATTVTITYFGPSTHTVRLVIPAGGVLNHSVYTDETVPIGFIGAARVQSGAPISAVVFRSKMTTAGSFVDEDLYTAVNGSPNANAATKLAFPSTHRRIGKDASHDGLNSWLSVSAPGGGAASVNLTTASRNYSRAGLTCDSAGAFSTTAQFNGAFVFYQNADTGNGLGANPACMAGSTTLTSNVPVLAVSSFINDRIGGDQEANFQVRPQAAPAGPAPTATAGATATPTPTPVPNPPGLAADPNMLYQVMQKPLDGPTGTRYCLDGYASGQFMRTGICASTSGQLWSLKATGGDAHILSPSWRGAGDCLQRTTAGQSPGTAACDSTPNDVWNIVPAAGAPGYFQILYYGPAAAPRCLVGRLTVSVVGCDPIDETRLWSFVPVSTVPLTGESIRYAEWDSTLGGAVRADARQLSATKWLVTHYFGDGGLEGDVINEVGRDGNAVELRLGGADVVLTTHNMRVREFDGGSVEASDLKAPSVLGPGYFLKGADILRSDGVPISMKQVGPSRWDVDGGTYKEVSRDHWMVKLVLEDGTRTVTIRLDSGIVTLDPPFGEFTYSVQYPLLRFVP
jgi:hypothetical protein